MQRTAKPANRNVINLLLDIVIFFGFLIATAPRLSGIAIHEWLGVAFAAAVITHLLLHWSWIVNVLRQFFSKASAMARFNYLLNILLFIDMTVIIFTGFLISEEVLPLLGITPPHGFAWRRIHDMSTTLGLVIVGLHIAVHWQWIVNVTKRLFHFPSRKAQSNIELNKVSRTEVTQ